MKKTKRRKRTSTVRLFFLALMGSFVLVCVAQPASPQVSIEIVTINDVDHVSVKWEEVEGAEAYSIYSSYDPYVVYWGDPIAIVGDSVFVYNVPVSDEKVRYFYVTATGEAPDIPGMIYVQGGTFNPVADYTVTLSSFYISKYVVTQSEWTSVMGGIWNPMWNHGTGHNYPAYRVSWFDAIEYCNRLSIREGLTPAYSYGDSGTNPANWPAGWNTDFHNNINISCNWNANGYRLPTEMEWEFAARGGVPAQQAGTFNDRWAGTDVEDELGDYAWYRDNAGLNLPGGGDHPDYGTHPVGTKLPHELGLYDMSGNVQNWVWDKFSYYPTGVHHNPRGSRTGTNLLLRGGCWFFRSFECRVDYRATGIATGRSPYTGFRVSRSRN